MEGCAVQSRRPVAVNSRRGRVGAEILQRHPHFVPGFVENHLIHERMDQDDSAAAFASLRSQLKATECKTIEEVVKVVEDQILPAIGQTRRYQTLQALINCTRRSLLPDPSVSDKQREQWQLEANQLESIGIR